MKSVIFCEGIDDQYILGYYLYNCTKSSKNPWMKTDKNFRFSNVMNLTKLQATIYDNGINQIAIVHTKGKDNFKEVFHDFSAVLSAHSSEILKIAIMMDRDNDDIDNGLEQIKEILTSGKVTFKPDFTLQNHHENVLEFIDENEENCKLTIIPIIIPFNEQGAIETLLMNGIAQQSKENHYVVENAKKYIEDIRANKNVCSYLKKRRLILKAKYSATISVTNPDRSTAVYNEILTAFPWHESPEINKHLGMLIHTL